MFSFKYSERPNTLALKRMPDDVPEEEKTRRIVALQALQKEIQGELYRAVRRPDSGRARRFAQPPARVGALGTHERQHRRELLGPRDWIGRIVPVRITDANPNSLRGEAIGA